MVLFGLRSGDFGGHLNLVNSLLCSINQVEIIFFFSFVTWYVIILEVAITRWVHCGHKGLDMVSKNTQVGCGM